MRQDYQLLQHAEGRAPYDACPMKLLALFLALVLPVQAAMAQAGQKKQQLTPERRQQMRQDMRDVYKDTNRRERTRQMAPQQREQLRRDVDEANRRMKR
jgi:hypothetical protein